MASVAEGASLCSLSDKFFIIASIFCKNNTILLINEIFEVLFLPKDENAIKIIDF